MSLQAQIEQKLNDTLEPLFMEVLNESHQHNVPQGSESHFKITIVDEVFTGKPLVARHKMLYRILQDELNNGVHALALHTYTPAEFEKKHGRIPDSPPCMGGGKKNESQSK